MDVDVLLQRLRTSTVLISEHALDKLDVLGLFARDVGAIVATCDEGALIEARADGSEKWKIYGFPVTRQDRTALVVDVKADGHVVVVTVHPYP